MGWDVFVKAVIAYVLVWILSWFVGGLILTLSIHHCWFIHTIATNLGVANGTFVNYANASLVIAILSTLKFKADVK